MNGNLIDTNAAIFAVTEPDRLSPAARRSILKGPNLVSAVTLWEVILKSMKGGLSIGDPHQWWRDVLDELAATALPLRPEHVLEIAGLPVHHKDPFDRVVIAQARVESLALVTSDRTIARYASSGLQVVW